MEEPARTRPSAIVQGIDPSQPVTLCTTAELLTYCLGRAYSQRDELVHSEDPHTAGQAAREFSLAIAHIEDAITRFNKGTYVLKGIFAISDAERS